MRLILENKLNKILQQKEFIFDFEIAEEGAYGIEIIASAKSWRQNISSLRSFFKDDNLTIKIDGITFPKKSGKRDWFDSETAFNGNNLKGLKKTDFFLINLSADKHNLTFLAKQNPKIEVIRIFQIQDEKIWYRPIDNYPIENSEQRQWLTIILCNLKLTFLKIQAQAEKKGRQDDDLKLIINGQVQKNQEPTSHKYWYWCGRTLKGKSKNFSQELNLAPNLNYIELWTKGIPKIEPITLNVSFGLENPQQITYPIFTLKDIQPYIYQGVKGNENYNRLNAEILEAVNFWNKTFFSQKDPPSEPLHPNLVKAMIYVESRMGYGDRGEEYYPAYPDVMQVADQRNPAIHTLNNDGWVDPRTGQEAKESEWTEEHGVDLLDYKGEANGKTAAASIYWGARWLYHKIQGITADGQRYWQSWRDAVMNYHYRGEKSYQEKIFDIYDKGVDPDGNELWDKSSSSVKQATTVAVMLGVFLVILLFFFHLDLSHLFKIYNIYNISGNINFDSLITNNWAPVPEDKLFVSIKKAILNSHLTIIKQIPIKNSSVSLGFIDNKPYSSSLGMILLDNDKDRVIELFKPSPSFFDLPNRAPIKEWQDQWRLGEYTDQLIIDDINGDNKTEVLVEFIYSGTGLVHPLYVYQVDTNKTKLLLHLEEGVSDVELKDFDNDGIKEIIYSFALDSTGVSGRTLTEWKEIWTWQDNQYKKVNNLYPEIYQNLVERYNFLLTEYNNEAIMYYRPLVECLKKNAVLNLQGVFSDGRKCVKNNSVSRASEV